MANFITILRMILAIVTVCLLFIHTTPIYIAAFILTVIVIWFDGLDGYVARKFNESSRFGALLDILGDRVVENVYWISFCALGFVPVWIPIVVVTRGLLTDGVRSLAFEKGYTAFGSTTMMQGKIAKFIVASNFVRFTYAVCKAMAFALLIAAYIPMDYQFKDVVTVIAYVCVYVSVFLCVLRGVPVLIESKRFFKEDEK
ncbi:MAG: CDP-alcohol phosphatidyltransferase family protein [Candidatus Gastranaerophilales bacterium]|nr:CDP-alcohol phosphatidyltransferase family protein [Candidatus Gastranaerophilales bacterium]